MQTLKMVVTGPFNAGKTEFIQSVSEIDVVSTERKISSEIERIKDTTTVAMDFGRITIDDEMSYMFGWVIKDVAIKAAEMACKKFGYENLTGKNVKQSLEELKDYDNGGLTHALSYGEGTEDRRGNKYSRLVEWNGESWEPFSDWYKVPFIKGK